MVYKYHLHAIHEQSLAIKYFFENNTQALNYIDSPFSLIKHIEKVSDYLFRDHTYTAVPEFNLFSHKYIILYNALLEITHDSNIFSKFGINQVDKMDEDFFNKLISNSFEYSHPLIDFKYLNGAEDVKIAEMAVQAWANVIDIKFILDDKNPDFSFLISYNIDHYMIRDEEDSNGFADCTHKGKNHVKCND